MRTGGTLRAPISSWVGGLPSWLLHPIESLGVVPSFLRPSKLGPKRSLLLGFTLGFSLSLSLTGLALYALDAWRRSVRRAAEKRMIEIRADEVVDGVEGLIGESTRVESSRLEDAGGLSRGSPSANSEADTVRGISIR